jgi:hypothetical protein
MKSVKRYSGKAKKVGNKDKKPSRLQRVFPWLGRIGLVGVLILGGLLAAVSVWPSLGARGADLLRGVVGDQAVARLEMEVYRIQDTFLTWKYDLGWATPAVPWGNSASPGFVLTPTATFHPSGIATLVLTAISPQGVTLLPTASQVPFTWLPGPLSPLGSLAGEGVWSPYIQDAAGQTIAYRAYLQPDPERPYAVVAVVAFDLTRTRLHFVLGSVEPYSPTGPKRTGEIPAADKAPGVLLAMFNGGFKATHGEFGAMADGLVALPAHDGLGTVVIYRDGRVRIGIWGTEITPTADMLAWRQNGPILIDHGEINPQVYNNSPKDWGYTVSDVSPTWRSGVGLSFDQKTLYYSCGSSLTMEALAKSMQTAGVDASIQLDINPYWVRFVTVQWLDQKQVLKALFPDTMKENIDRYLWPYTRDYFYVTWVR